MSKKLAILGHEYRGKEVVDLLKALGGKDADDYQCSNPNIFYYISDEYVYLSVHLNKLPFWKRLKVAIQYLFGKQSKYGAFDEVIIGTSEYKKFQDMVDFMKDVELYKMSKE